MDELAFTSKEVIAIINGGCLCTIGRGTCQLHALTDTAPEGDDEPCYPRYIGPE